MESRQRLRDAGFRDRRIRRIMRIGLLARQCQMIEITSASESVISWATAMHKRLAYHSHKK